MTLARRIRRTIRRFVKAHDQDAWAGPVVRLDELTDAELADVKGSRPRAIRLRSVHETWRCANAWCRQWTMNGAHRTGRCNFCHEPRPPHNPAAFGRPRPGDP